MTATIYTEVEIAEAVADYAGQRGVEVDSVEVTRNFEGGEIIGFRLSTGQNGGDERFGRWN